MLAAAARGGTVLVGGASLAGSHLSTVGLLLAIPAFCPRMPGVLIVLGEVPQAKALAFAGLCFLASASIGQIPAAASAIASVSAAVRGRIVRSLFYLAGTMALTAGFAGALGILGDLERSLGYIERSIPLGAAGGLLQRCLASCKGGSLALYLLLLDGGLLLAAAACLAVAPGRRRGKAARGA
mgnify:CR=1 FL=1